MYKNLKSFEHRVIFTVQNTTIVTLQLALREVCDNFENSKIVGS